VSAAAPPPEASAGPGSAAAPAPLRPVILVGGDTANAVSIAHSLGPRGVPVYLLCRAGATPTHSKYTRRLPVDGGPDAWAGFLLDPGSDHLRGSVLIACSDDAVQLLLEHRDQLAARFVLDSCAPEAQWCFLSKLCTYEAARAAGVPTPLFWRADTPADIAAHRDEYVYPLLLKPLFSHRFRKVFEGKYFVVHDYDELVATFAKAYAEGVEILLLEEIPGDDDRLCSMYTYIDERGEPAFRFTKRILRRYPEHQGFGSYHITDWDPDRFELGMRLVRHVGLRGLANVEFKRDDRDGKLKVMECNIRFTAANQIVVASGYDLPWFVYSRLTGLPVPPLDTSEYRRGTRLWFPIADFLAFVDLRRQGRLTLRDWVASVLRVQALPYFRWDDPMPSLQLTRRYVRSLSKKALRKALGRRGAAPAPAVDPGFDVPRDDAGDGGAADAGTGGGRA
jgi:predicted ATP-grasp superfamily ATP-dependent carboligase